MDITKPNDYTDFSNSECICKKKKTGVTVIERVLFYLVNIYEKGTK